MIDRSRLPKLRSRPSTWAWVVLALFAGLLTSAAAAASPSTPAHGTPPDRVLSDVSAALGQDVWAVGYTGYPRSHALIDHWDGSAWSRVPAPNPGPGNTRLGAVDALAGDDAWAVGEYRLGRQRALILHWDGTSWTQASAPSPGHRGAELDAITSSSATDVWAVGHYFTNSTREASPLVEHWDGTSWTTLRMPKPGENTWLSTVMANSPTDVTVAGGYGDGSADDQIFFAHWDGTSWTVTYPPSPGVDDVPLSSYAASPTDQWIGGRYRVAITTRLLMEHWNGTTWKRVRGESPPDSVIGDMAGTSSTDVWAIGSVGPYPDEKPLVKHWDGVNWSRIPDPRPGPNLSYSFTAVTAAAADDAWIVGDAIQPGGNDAPIAAHWDGTAWRWAPAP